MKGMEHRPEVSMKYAIVVNLESSKDELDFGDFKITKLDNTTRTFDLVQQEFGKGNVSFGDWLLEWESGVVPENAEDYLLLLRLFKAGDISFTRVSAQSPSGEKLMVAPYELISDINRNSSFPSTYEYEDCERFKEFAPRIRKSIGWTSQWFKIARSAFQLGCSKEFHVDVDSPANNKVDRILYFMISLKAVFTPEDEFVGKRLRERVSSLIGRKEEDDKKVMKKLLGRFYDVRSTIAHGGELSRTQRTFVRDNRSRFEEVVRDALKISMEEFPADEKRRPVFLKNLFDVTDKERSDKIVQDFRAIKDLKAREYLLEELTKRTVKNQ
jgi:hypothetical protein